MLVQMLGSQQSKWDPEGKVLKLDSSIQCHLLLSPRCHSSICREYSEVNPKWCALLQLHCLPLQLQFLSLLLGLSFAESQVL